MKKALSLILSIVMLLSVITVSVVTSAQVGDRFVFEAENCFDASNTNSTTTSSSGLSGWNADATEKLSDQTFLFLDNNGKAAVDHYVTFNLTGLETGSYEVHFGHRTSGSRSTYKVEAWDSSSTVQTLDEGIDFKSTTGATSWGSYFYSYKTTNEVNVTKGDSLTLKLTITTADSNGAAFDKILLVKTADSDGGDTTAPSEEDTTTTTTTTTPIITPPSVPSVGNLSEKLADTSDFSLSSIEYTEQMLIAYNIGNCFEMTELRSAYVRPEISNINDHIRYKETMAGNVLVTEEYIKYLKSIGIQAIRLPVTWFNMLEDENGNIYPKDTWYSDIETRREAWYNGKINEEFLARVKQVVDWIIENDMYCIINTHHDAAANTSNAVNPIKLDEAYKEQTYNYLTNIWGQVGSYFKNYGSKLMFEFYNEATSNSGHMTASDTADDFTSDLLCYLISLIRNQGSNNANRFLVCPRYGGVSMWSNNEYLQRFVNSDTADDKIVVTTHTYTTVSSLPSSIKGIRNWMNNTGIGAIVDEFGATDGGSNLKEKSINSFADVRKASDEYKVSCWFWDGGHQDCALTNRYYLKPSAPALGAYVGKDIDFEFYTQEEVLELTKSTQPNWVKLYTENGSDYAGKYLLITSANKITNLYKSELSTGYYSHTGAENGLLTYFTSDDGVNYNLMSTNVPTPWTKIAWNQLQVSGSTYYTKQIDGNYQIEKIGYGLQNYAPTGSNLVAGDWQKGQYAINGKYEGEGTTYYSKRISLVDKIQVTPNEYYAFETTRRYKFIVRSYDESGNFVSNLGTVDNGVLQIPDNAYQISVSMYDTGSPAASADELLSYIADGTLSPAIYLYSPVSEQDGPTTDIITTGDTASIRLNQLNGIRFYTTVDAEKIAELKEAGKEVTMGTIIAPADKVENVELTHELGEANYIDVKYTANEYYAENTIVGSIVNIKEANIGRKFVGRGYVCVDGTYYYSETTSTRSLKSVATALKNDANNTALYEAHQDLVDKWANAAEWVPVPAQ